MASNPPSGASTPRFVSQNETAEDLLKTQTVGLVNFSDYKKRRADVLEQKEREAQDRIRSETQTPVLDESDHTLTPGPDSQPSRKKKKSRAMLSFDQEDHDDGPKSRARPTPNFANKEPVITARKLKPNPTSSTPAIKAMTKAAQAAEVEERERLRREFLEMQEKVKAAEIAVPFVFYDGANIPGATVKIKKSDHVWLLLERARKVAAEKGSQGSGAAAGSINAKNRDHSKKQWARIGVDDLMLVRGEVIVPHHYEIYYFVVNKTMDPSRPGKLLFDYSGTAPEERETPLLRVPGQEKLEGQDDDPGYTKVVDRRWYQRHKHIFPASTWKEFKAGKEFEEAAKQRKDAEGNSFFFS